MAGIVSATLIFLVMLIMIIDISGRAVLNLPVPSTFEIIEATMPFIVFLAWGYVEAKGENIRIDLLTRHIHERWKGLWNGLTDILTCVAGIFFFGLMTWGTFKHALGSWHVGEFMTGTVHLPLYPSKFIVPVGTALLLVQFSISLAKSVAGLLDGREKAA